MTLKRDSGSRGVPIGLASGWEVATGLCMGLIQDRNMDDGWISVATGYFPLNCGLRFSMKAVRPSRKSSESMQAVPIFLIASISRLLSSFSTSAIVTLAALIASG